MHDYNSTIRSSESARPGSARVARSRSVWVAASMCLLSLTLVVVAQQPGAVEAPPTVPPKSASLLDNLVVKQGKIADKYAYLEQLLIRMSELEATNNPQRAALLKRAAQQSSNKLTRQQLNTLVKLLAPPAQLKRAVDEQQQVVADLKALLELLQSENRADRLKNEQTRIKDYIKEVERLIRLQQGIQGRTEGGDDANKLAKDQEQVADRTGQLAKRVQETEEGSKTGEQSSDKSKSSDSKSGEAKESDKSGDANNSTKKKADGDKSPGSEEGKNAKKGQDKSAQEKGEKEKSSDKESDEKAGQDDPSKQPNDKSSDNKSGDDKSGDDKSDQKSTDQQKSSDSKKSSGGQQKSGSPKKSGSQKDKSQGKGEPAESPDSEQQPDQPSPEQEQDQANPARKRLQAAEDRMREAQRKLSEAKQKDATAEQEKAREELEKAKAELEQILRQMREEEIERTLAMLEGRFRRMLESQLKIYESTKRLDKIPMAQRSRDIDIQASKLGFEEGKLAVDADKALLLLREEGSSIAFPETVEMMRDDMQQVSERLSATQIDRVTQGIEEEIIQTLEELVAALQKAQQDLKDKKQPPPMQPQKPIDPSDRPLVDQLAELRMIRSLQLRVNTRTQRYSRLLENVDDPVGRANDADLRESLIKLAELEKRVHEITRNLVLGKNE